ncbi:hypothetical protein BDF19DRAFT_194534 [Syncephalis fuscata]|nr:hypothetical protein BDF19DRAFT_194534 [Syncephalis fuscata]
MTHHPVAKPIPVAQSSPTSLDKHREDHNQMNNHPSNNNNNNNSESCPVANTACRDSTFDCNGNQFAQCVFGRWVMRTCMSGTVCHRTADLNSVFCDFPTDLTPSCSSRGRVTAAQKLAVASERHSLWVSREQATADLLPDQKVRMVYLNANSTHMEALASASAGKQPFGRDWEFELAVPHGTRVVRAIRTQGPRHEKMVSHSKWSIPC